MQTVSGRISDDLYQWFASLQLDGAVTSSDKLRELLAQTRRHHEGALDFVSAQAWIRDILNPLRTRLAELERDHGLHSDVVAQIIEHVTGMMALLRSSQPQSPEDAKAFEDALVRRAIGMGDALLRHALTSTASAYDAGVVRRHAGKTAELLALIN